MKLVKGKADPLGFWEFLLNESAASNFSNVENPDLDKRAVISLKKTANSLNCLIKNDFNLNHELRKEFSSYNKHIEEILTQGNKLANALPAYSWGLAKSLVSADKNRVLSWLKNDTEMLSLDPAYNYVCEVTGKAIEGAKTKGGTVKWKGKEEFQRAAINSTGGFDHFLIYTFACFILLQNFNVFFAICSGFDRFDEAPKRVLLNPKTLEILSIDDDVWNLSFIKHIAIIKRIEPYALSVYFYSLADQLEKMFSCLNEAVGHLDKHTHSLELSTRETKSLRKQLASFEEFKKESARRIANLTDEVHRLKIQKSKPEQHGARDAEMVALIRENKRLSEENEEINNLLAEMKASELELKEFISMALDEPRESTQKNDGQLIATINDSSKENKNILFVGGHEKLHAKLRKLLPKVRFVHPDVASIPQETFTSVDVIIFCVGYCSHAIYWRVLQEARKRCLPMGYTNNNNVDLILNDILKSIDKLSTP